MFGRKRRNPLKVGRRPGIMIFDSKNSDITEQFRTIQTNIKFTMVDKKLKSLVVTSAGRDAGKSFIAVNLAATFASEEFRVLLVDADLRKPTVHKNFNLQNKKGLTTLLMEDSRGLKDKIYKTEVKGLYVLTSGPIPPNPADILSSNRMSRVQEEAENHFDLVIFDTPPILPVTDALIMASKVDGTVFVIPKAEVTKDELIKSKELLRLAEVNIIGAIFNRTEEVNGDYYYGDES